MTPQGLITYCKLNQRITGNNLVMVELWTPGAMTSSGRARLFDRRGPSGEIMAQDGEGKDARILLSLRASEVINELNTRLYQDYKRNSPGRVERITESIQPGAEVVASG